MLKLLPIALLLTAVAWSSTAYAAENIDATARCPKRSADDYFFPTGSLSTNAGSDAGMRRWYSRHLLAMKTTSLSCGAGGERYRFTWLRTFDHPISISIWVDGANSKVEAVELDGAGGYEPGKEYARLSILMEPSKQRELADALKAADFWAWPPSTDARGFDGSEWIVEGRKDGRYRVRVDWSPEEGVVRDFGLRLLSLVGWNTDIENVY